MVAIKKQSVPYIKIIAFLAVFLLLYAINFVLPLEKSFLHLHYRNISHRMWSWYEILIAGLALHIFTIKKVNLKDLIISIILGLITSLYFYDDMPGILMGIIPGVATAVCFYSGCQIFRRYSQQNKFFDLGTKDTIKSLLLGALYAIPFAIFRNLAMGNIHYTGGIISASLVALVPGIYEEVVFHFFLLAFVTYLFEGNIPQNKLALSLTYILAIVPHSLIRLPLILTQNPLEAVWEFTITSLLCGLPMLWLVKNKNLQTSIGFHWSIDFIRMLFWR